MVQTVNQVPRTKQWGFSTIITWLRIPHGPYYWSKRSPSHKQAAKPRKLVPTRKGNLNASNEATQTTGPTSAHNYRKQRGPSCTWPRKNVDVYTLNTVRWLKITSNQKKVWRVMWKNETKTDIYWGFYRISIFVFLTLLQRFVPHLEIFFCINNYFKVCIFN